MMAIGGWQRRLRLGALVAFAVGCGGAPASGGGSSGGSEGASGPTYDILASRDIAVGTSWEEHALDTHLERTVTRVLGNETAESSATRVELLGTVTVLENATGAERTTILVHSFLVESADGVRPLFSQGEELFVTHGATGTITSARGPIAEETLALARRVISTSALRGSGEAEADARAAFAPPGGRAAVGQHWTFDDAALARFFVHAMPGATVRREDVGGGGELRPHEAVDGLECVLVHVDVAIHDMRMPSLPPGVSLDDIESRMAGDFVWPTDLHYPEPADAFRSETTLVMHAIAESGVRADVVTTISELRERARTSIRVP